MKKYISLIIILFLCGCSINTYLTIDVLKPAKQPVLEKSADVALITDVFDPPKCGQSYLFENRTVLDTTCRVRLHAEIFMEGVQDIVGDSQFFTDVANVGLLQKNTPLSDILSLTQDDNPDILLVLNDFKMKDETYFVPSIYGGYAVTRGIVSTSLLFYDAASQALIGKKSLIDSVYWISKEISRYEFMNLERGERESILAYLAYEAGKKVATYFFPAWMEVDRVLIVAPGKESLNASEAALAGAWGRADYFWEALSKDKNKKKQSAAWFNRAVYQEINEDFETAMDFVKRADALHSRKIHKVYLDVLEERANMKREFERLMSETNELRQY